ncbi:MAG: hypothetical protein AAF149_11900 [Bacteroidota bacterium]
MIAYLENLYELTKSDDLAIILGSMQLMEDGSTMDSAYWYDWLGVIEKIRN